LSVVSENGHERRDNTVNPKQKINLTLYDLLSNTTYVAEVATEFGGTNANSAGCQSFAKAYICISEMINLTPPCSISTGDVSLACFSSCINGLNACGMSASNSEDQCLAFVYFGFFAAEGQSNCYNFNTASSTGSTRGSSTGFASILSYDPVFSFLAFLAISLYWM